MLVHPEDTQASDADLSRVEFAICWAPPRGLLQRVRRDGVHAPRFIPATAHMPSVCWPPPPMQCPNLKAIQSMGAGVDSLIGDDTLPRAVPLLRVIDPLMSERMATWVLWGVINCQVGPAGAGWGRAAAAGTAAGAGCVRGLLVPGSRSWPCAKGGSCLSAPGLA